MALEPEADATAADAIAAGRPRAAEPLPRREILTESTAAAAFVAVAIAMGLLLDADRDWEPQHVVILMALMAGALRAPIDVGAGYTSPIQLVFVPMLLLLPTPWVPLLVALAWQIGRLPELVTRAYHPTRAILIPANAWFAVGPALVLVALDAQMPDWSKWPAYVLALLAQFAFDVFFGELRESLARGLAPRLQLAILSWVMLIDALLAPIGLLAAFASLSFEYAYMLLVPPTVLLFFYAGERARRYETALALVEAEREATRSREELIAGASHEMLTPLAVVTGLARRLDSDAELDPESRAGAIASMRRELTQLRHLVRQFVDYTRLKADREPTVRARPTDLGKVVREAAGAWATRAALTVRIEDGLPLATADADRVHQMLMILLSNAVKFSDPQTPIDIDVSDGGANLRIAVTDRGRGIPAEDVPTLFEELRRGSDTGGMEGSGIGLYICRALALGQGGDVTVRSRPGEGSTFTITLPRA